jgi:NAD(P)-dependent dehydrogenase (short-subunit alcohol dehydrogenase family)
MSEEFEGRVAVITGAASGIGRAIADALVEQGAAVVYADLDGAAAAQAAGDGATGAQVDVSDGTSVASLFDRLRERHGGVDIVVNVAGVQRAGAVVDLDESDWDLQMSVNAKGCFLMAKHAIPLMEGRAGATIVNIASIAGVRGYPGVTGYSASKGAIIAFGRGLAREVAPLGIRVMTLSPGWVDTPFNDPVTAEMGGRPELESSIAATVPMGRQSTPPEIAKAALFLVSDAASYMTGSNLLVDGGLDS